MNRQMLVRLDSYTQDGCARVLCMEGVVFIRCSSGVHIYFLYTAILNPS